MGPPAAEPKRSGLKLRLLSAAVLVPIVLLLVYLGAWPFAMLVAVASGIMLFEWLQMLYRTGALPAGLAGLGMAIAVVLLGQGWPVAGFGMLALTGGVVWVIVSGPRRRWWIALGLVWIALPCVALVWLRQAPDGGLAAVLWTLVMIWSADTGAYFAGRGIGGPKLAPSISPNKTWAGLVGGMLTAAVASVLFALVMGGQALLTAALLAALLAPWSQVGDLAESAIKRHVGVKDSGKLIPGHGGILDRVDALLFAAPAVALIAAVWPMGNLPWH